MTRRGSKRNRWNDRKEPVRKISYREVVGTVIATAKRAAQTSRTRNTSEKDSNATQTKAKRLAFFPHWQLELLLQFETSPWLTYSWIEAKVLQYAAAERAANKAQERLETARELDAERLLSPEASVLISGGGAKKSKQLLQDVDELLDLLQNSELAAHGLMDAPTDQLVSFSMTHMQTEDVSDSEMIYLPGQRDEHMVFFQNIPLVDWVMRHYQTIRSLDLTNFHSTTRTTTQQIPDNTTNASSREIKASGKKKSLRQKRLKRGGEELACEREMKRRSIILDHRPLPWWLQPHLHHLLPMDDYMCPEVYACLQFTMQVSIAGVTHMATIDTSQESTIDARLLPGWGNDFNLPDRPPKPQTFNDLLFQRPFDAPCAKVAIGMIRFDDFKILKITPRLTYKPMFEFKIVLGKDLFVQEQISCRPSHLMRPGKRIIGWVRLLVGGTRILVTAACRRV